MSTRWAHTAALAATATVLFLSSGASAQSGSDDNSPDGAEERNELVKVVQPKPVRKKGRLEVTPFFAYQPNDDFVRGYVPGVIAGYHINEGLALEVTGAYGFHSNKQLLGTIRNLNAQPKVLDRMKYLVNGGFSWAPIYGKIAVLNRWILTYDFYVAAGAGITATELEITNETSSGNGGVGEGTTYLQDEQFFDTYIGLGQRYFWKDWAAFRFEVKNFSYVQVVDSGFNVRNNLLLAGGFSFFF